MSVSKYQERYCAFVDILGFRNLIESIESGATSFEALRNILNQLYSPIAMRDRTIAESDYRAQSISDAIVISTFAHNWGLTTILYFLEHLANELLGEGYFLRGAIVKGNLYHDERMVFGPALVRAYEMESKVASVPRIVIEENVVRDANIVGEHPLIGCASDGLHFLNVLWRLKYEASTSYSEESDLIDTQEKRIARYSAMQRGIQGRVAEVAGNPKHFKKVSWFAHYWNETLPSDSAVMKIVNLDPT